MTRGAPYVLLPQHACPKIRRLVHAERLTSCAYSTRQKMPKKRFMNFALRGTTKHATQEQEFFKHFT
jgi:hypothetical protein